MNKDFLISRTNATKTNEWSVKEIICGPMSGQWMAESVGVGMLKIQALFCWL